MPMYRKLSAINVKTTNSTTWKGLRNKLYFLKYGHPCYITQVTFLRDSSLRQLTLCYCFPHCNSQRWCYELDSPERTVCNAIGRCLQQEHSNLLEHSFTWKQKTTGHYTQRIHQNNTGIIHRGYTKTTQGIIHRGYTKTTQDIIHRGYTKTAQIIRLHLTTIMFGAI